MEKILQISGRSVKELFELPKTLKQVRIKQLIRILFVSQQIGSLYNSDHGHQKE